MAGLDPQGITVSSAFDAGNIELLAPIALAGEQLLVRLQLRRDAGGEHMQWFHFSVSGARGLPLLLCIENAGQCSYPPAWHGYQACVSVDRRTWTRIADTRYQDGQLSIVLTPRADRVWLAYFAPYDLERLQDRVAGWCQDPRVRYRRVGQTVEGRDIDLLQVGQEGPGKRALWFVGRQHPGESMASWWMEGFLDRLLDPADALARRILDQAVVYCVPHINPDGSVRGHLRTNAAGANLNREWEAPDAARSPEVLAVRDHMDRVGCDLCLDVHGDEELPYNFLSGAEGIPGWTPRLAELSARFKQAYIQADPDLQAEKGYPVDPPGGANMTMCSNAVAQRFDCLAYTLEMPFKDNALAPDPVHGWSPPRCQRLGAAALDAVAAVLPTLR